VRVLITGAGGQLGLDLIDAFEGHDVTALTRTELDVAQRDQVEQAIAGATPDVVVNAAAWTDVDGCEADEDRAHAVNALGPWWLARACGAAGAELVTVSTDYVFDGTAPRDGDGQPRPLTEFDPVDPLNAYGRSKAAGEVLVRQTLDRHYIVRTAWVAGARGSNFVRTMLRLARERDHVAVVDDQIGSPTFTRDLAAAIVDLAGSGLYGTWNRTNSGRCSWFDLAAATFELSGLDVDLRPQPSSALDRPAPRPAWSVMSGTHAELAGLTPLPPWRDGLERLLDELGELR